MSMNSNIINEVVEKTIRAIESSKDEIYKIVENARTQVESIKKEIDDIQREISVVIDEVDRLEFKDKTMRKKLVQVSKFFEKYSEEEVKDVYEKASEIRIEYKMKEQEEKSLRARRSSLEVNLKQAEEILRSAEKLIGQVSVAMNFLAGELGNVSGADNETSFEFGVQLLETLENEKRKISREIHDGPAQSLANIVMKTDIAKAVLKRDLQQGFAELDGLKDSVRSTLQEIRHIIYELRPGLLEEKALTPAIESLIADFKNYTSCEVVLLPGKERTDMSSSMQVAVFRLIQESLNNIKKHANATKVQIRLEYSLKFVNVKIVDNGNGFDTEKIFDEKVKSGTSFGLKGMKERIEQLSGEFNCRSQEGVGTEMTFKIPINKEVMHDVYRSN